MYAQIEVFFEHSSLSVAQKGWQILDFDGHINGHHMKGRRDFCMQSAKEGTPMKTIVRTFYFIFPCTTLYVTMYFDWKRRFIPKMVLKSNATRRRGWFPLPFHNYCYWKNSKWESNNLLKQFSARSVGTQCRIVLAYIYPLPPHLKERANINNPFPYYQQSQHSF